MCLPTARLRAATAVLLLAALAHAQPVPPQPPLLALHAPVTSLDGAGDLDGDGYSDIVASEDGWGMRAFSGRTGALIWFVPATVQALGFAGQIDGGMDRDGDGVPDVLYGAPKLVTGAVGVISGADGSESLALGPAPGVGWSAGEAVAWLGDVDGDGVPDAAIGEPLGPYVGPGPQPRDGVVHIFSGADGDELYARQGETGDKLGGVLASTGDVDLDGFPDFIVGASQQSWPPPGHGYVRLYSGDSGVLLRIWSSAELGVGLGTSLAGIGDIDGDGVPDMALGTRNDSVLLATGADGSVLDTLPVGDGALLGYGGHVVGLGDVDGDDVPDIGVSVRGYSQAPDGARIHSGANRELIHEYGYMYGANNDGPLMLAPVGDVNGDGSPDVALAIPAKQGVFVFGRGGAYWKDLGSGLSGRSGVPTLHATGVLANDELLNLDLTDAAPYAPAVLVMGAPGPQPLLGGTLVPTPDVLIHGLVTDGGGTLTVEGRWPPLFSFQAPFGSEFVFQVWVADATGPAGFSASNAMSSYRQ